MKITTIHGDNTPESFNYLQQLVDSFKNKGFEISRISEGTSFSLPETLSSSNLFGKNYVYILQNPKTLSSKDMEWIKKKGSGISAELIIYQSSQMPSALLKTISQISEVREFKLPKTIFAFLDSFAPGNASKCLVLLHTLLKRQAPEFVFAALARHVRDLYWVKVAPRDLDYPEWRLTKLRMQSDKFSEDKLTKIINSLARIDLASKTSKQGLAPSLDLLIASRLQ
ncbi:hypothetical protein A2115_00495 [Candidatus Woesebacteria bacterium GWA1_41_8]|uniref:DNA-directed DNA polymerase n=1 Tax=Candidatus Woesebacteria bacterium GWA1_41_8 TaxID=1802471 RepID=A0A1F7WGF6_9BACT|nr:MAG: hypothetical protein A2115_00495 [Candidatus Woesebacteria bacterium GWA1_41_8]